MEVLTNTSFKNGYGSFWVTFWVFRDACRSCHASFLWLLYLGILGFKLKKNSEIIVEDFSTLDHLPSTLD